MWKQSDMHQSADAVIRINDVELPVHSMILASESNRFRMIFHGQRIRKERLEIDLGDYNIHSIWRLLELVYCRSCTTDSCPKTTSPGRCIRKHHYIAADYVTDLGHPLSKHAAVCELAESWGLSVSLREIAQATLRETARQIRSTKELVNALEAFLTFSQDIGSTAGENPWKRRNEEIIIRMIRVFFRREETGSL